METETLIVQIASAVTVVMFVSQHVPIMMLVVLLDVTLVTIIIVQHLAPLALHARQAPVLAVHVQDLVAMFMRVL
jgi:hypothetical protein